MQGGIVFSRLSPVKMDLISTIRKVELSMQRRIYFMKVNPTLPYDGRTHVGFTQPKQIRFILETLDYEMSDLLS